jgi:hypothetical protein
MRLAQYRRRARGHLEFGASDQIVAGFCLCGRLLRLQSCYQPGRRGISGLDTVSCCRDLNFRVVEAALSRRGNRRMDDAAAFDLFVPGPGCRFS